MDKMPPDLKPAASLLSAATPGVPAARTSKRKTQQDTWESIIDRFGDPLSELAEIAFDKSLPVAVRKDALKEVVQYGHSKRRSIEVTGADGNPIEVRLKLIDEISQAMSKLGAK
jgi:hypothetical protein